MDILHRYLYLSGIMYSTKRAIRAALNLTADAAVWFRAKNPNLEALTWPELKKSFIKLV